MSNIEWTDRTWNPVRGCSKVSPGCTNCYAERTAARQAHSGYAGLVRIGEGSPRWTGEVRLVPSKLAEPLSWKGGRTFVNSMSDLWHEKLTDEEIAQVFASMALAPDVTFQVLTKRALRMRDLLVGSFRRFGSSPFYDAEIVAADKLRARFPRRRLTSIAVSNPGIMPLPNVWLGVSVENQAAADERIPLLLETPAAVRFLSVEPLLSPVDLRSHIGPFDDAAGFIDWVIVGGESGPGARPCDVAWIRSVVEQCKAAGVPCFVKQLGAAPTLDGMRLKDVTIMRIVDRKGGDPDEWPRDLRVREFPRGAA